MRVSRQRRRVITCSTLLEMLNSPRQGANEVADQFVKVRIIVHLAKQRVGHSDGRCGDGHWRCRRCRRGDREDVRAFVRCTLVVQPARARHEQCDLIDRFAGVVVASGINTLLPVVRHGVRRQCDDRERMAAGPQHTRQRIAVHLRHLHIGDEQQERRAARSRGRDHVKGNAAVLCDDDLRPRATQMEGDQPLIVFAVLRQQDAAGQQRRDVTRRRRRVVGAHRQHAHRTRAGRWLERNRHFKAAAFARRRSRERHVATQ